MRWIMMAALVFSTTAWPRRSYRYTLDPNRAEEILAGIQLNQPISKDRWLTLLGDRRNDVYTVQPGDNLWSISGRTFGDPRLWRKIWAMNPSLSNPHDISTGQILAYYREGLEAPRFEIPLVKLVPNTPGRGTDLDSDSLVNLEIKNQYRPSFMVVDEKEFIGELTGAYSARKWISMHEDVYAKFTDPALAVAGSTIALVRVDREVRDRTDTGAPILGTLVRLVAEAKVLQTVDGKTKIDLIRQLATIQRGDKIIAARPPLVSVPTFNPPDDMTARIVMGEEDMANYIRQGEIVLVNVGSNEGVKDGYLFRVTDDTDPLLETTNAVGLNYKGEIQLISVGTSASVGLVLRNTMPLKVGDTLVAAQKFPDRERPPRRSVKEIELD